MNNPSRTEQKHTMYPMYTNNNLHTPLISGNRIGKSITIPSGSQGAVNVALDEVLHQEQVGDASARFATAH